MNDLLPLRLSRTWHLDFLLLLFAVGGQVQIQDFVDVNRELIVSVVHIKRGFLLCMMIPSAAITVPAAAISPLTAAIAVLVAEDRRPY
jgi:hypothetical protein